jgi:uncharacterized protein (TIGR03067 family)
MTRRLLLAGLFLGLLAAAALGTPAPKLDPVKDALRALKGDWEVVSRVENGTPAAGGDRLLTFDSEKYTLRMAGNVVAEATIKVTPTDKPAGMDLTFTYEGPNKGKTQHLIYKIEGDTITFCVAPMGQPRPAEFSSKEGSGLTLSTYKRQKK